jgi:ligand-binding sensor domain-containing protein
MDKNCLHPLNPQGVWRTYTVADGLIGYRFEHIAEDAEGFLWFGSHDSGVNRFDGSEFINFTSRDGLCGNQVFVLLNDSQDRLWFGTQDGGLCWYDGSRFHTFKDEITRRPIFFLYEDRQGRIWFAGNLHDTLGYFDGDRFHDLAGQYSVDPDSLLNCWGIAQDETDSMWFAYRDLLLVYQDGRLLPAWSGENRFFAIAPHPQKGLWLATETRLGHWHDDRFEALEETTGTVRKIQLYRHNRPWFCSIDGATCYDGDRFHHFTVADGLPNPLVNGMLQDREGQLWFATWGGGIGCYDPDSIQPIDYTTTPHIGSSAIETMCEDSNGRLWMGLINRSQTNNQYAVKAYGATGVENFGPAAGLNLEQCSALYIDLQGNVWAGGRTGLFRGDGCSFKPVPIKKLVQDSLVSALAGDQQGCVYLGYSTGPTHVGILRFDGERSETLVDLEVDSVPINHISAIVVGPQNEVWFAVRSLQGLQADKGLGCWRQGEAPVFYSEDLPHRSVEALALDDQGHLWAATLDGLACHVDGRFNALPVGHTPAQNRIMCLCRDRRGRWWLGTDNGVVQYDGRSFQTIRSPHIGYTIEIVESHDGSLWFATLDGLVRYTPSHIAPRIRLLQITADQVYHGSHGGRSNLAYDMSPLNTAA